MNFCINISENKMRIPSVVTGTCEFAWDACLWGEGQEVQTARWPQQSTQPVAIVALVVASSSAAASSHSFSSSWPGRHSSIHPSINAYVNCAGNVSDKCCNGRSMPN